MLNLRDIIGFFLKVWRETQRLLLVLWLCRISTVSALLALVLAFLPQIQDLYTEITYYKTPSWQDHINTLYYWFTFYALCFYGPLPFIIAPAPFCRLKPGPSRAKTKLPMRIG